MIFLVLTESSRSFCLYSIVSIVSCASHWKGVNGFGTKVETLIETGIVRNPRDGVKILGNGELTKKLDVKVNAFSASAVEKIQALGGKAEVI